jgi:hypothetical protein
MADAVAMSEADMEAAASAASALLLLPEPALFRGARGLGAAPDEDDVEMPGSTSPNEESKAEPEWLEAEKVARASTPEYTQYFKKVIEAVCREEVQGKRAKVLLDVTDQTVSKYKLRALRNHNRCLYNGVAAGQIGRPRYLTEEVCLALMEEGLRAKQTRSQSTPQAYNSKLANGINVGLLARGHENHLLPKDWTPSPSILKELKSTAGIDVRSCGTDNAARAEALAQGRNLISNFSAVNSVCDAKYTSDGKDVPLGQRGNFDAVDHCHYSEYGEQGGVCCLENGFNASSSSSRGSE